MQHVDITNWTELDPRRDFVIDDHDPPQHEAQAWLQQATALGLACAEEVRGERAGEPMNLVLVARLAAATIWRTSGMAPCWSKLDVERLQRELRAFGFERTAIVALLASLGSFYAFLLKRGVLSSEDGEPLLWQLFPYVTENYRRRLAGEEGDRPGTRRQARPRGGRRRSRRTRRERRRSSTLSTPERSPFVPSEWLK